MEQFNIILNTYRDNNDGTIYCEFVPSNVELKNLILNGSTITILGSVEETIQNETLVAKSNMFEVLQLLYPNIAINYFL